MKAGDRIVYVLSRTANYPERRFPGVVVNVTPLRVVIRLDGHKSHRNVLASSVVPEGPR
jgi:hypothetical protein